MGRRQVDIPPTLWATGGLEVVDLPATLFPFQPFQLLSFFPLGRGLPLPLSCIGCSPLAPTKHEYFMFQMNLKTSGGKGKKVKRRSQDLIYHRMLGPNFLRFGRPDGLFEAPDPPGRALDASWAAGWPGGAGDPNFFHLLGAFTTISKPKTGPQNQSKST